MAPAAHRSQQPYQRHTALSTHAEHRGPQGESSIYEIAVPSVSTSVAFDNAHPFSPSPSPPPTGPLLLSVPSVTSFSTPTPPSAPCLQTPSNYPKPSPPMFLYPEPIVPRRGSECAMQRDARELGLLTSRSNDLSWGMPVWLTVLMFGVITVATTWTILVCAIHWRGATTGMSQAPHHPRKNKNRDKDGWRAWIVRKNNPFGKAGKYTALATDAELEDCHAAALTSAHDVPAQLAYPSPLNPYLVPSDSLPDFSGRSLRPRDSSEWAAEHRAFFLASHSCDVSAAQSRASSSTHSLSGSEREDVESEAREAQGRRASLGRELGRLGDGGETRASWVDVGLALVDGAVDRAAARIVRWADDGGRDEGLVLPLVKGKTD